MTRLWVAILALTPSLALGCPVCGTAPERSRLAYQLMTGVMTFLPLILLGTLFVLFLRRVRRAEAIDDLARRAPAQPTPASVDAPKPSRLTSTHS